MTDPVARLRPALTVLEGVVMVVGGEGHRVHGHLGKAA